MAGGDVVCWLVLAGSLAGADEVYLIGLSNCPFEQLRGDVHHAPTQVRRFLIDLRATLVDGTSGGKVVVFSQLKETLTHVATVLRREKIGFASIVPGGVPPVAMNRHVINVTRKACCIECWFALRLAGRTG